MPIDSNENPLNTPDGRLLLSLLEQAQAVAERVDHARGRVDTSVLIRPGQSAGYDLAEAVSLITQRVRREVSGSD